MHTLLVLRHAQAGGAPGVHDTARPLTGRGRRDAERAGRWLLARDTAPDWVVCSPARRARETWERVNAALGAAAPAAGAVIYEPRVYDAGVQDLLDLVNEQPEEARTVLLVGHNPAALHLAAGLTGRPDLAFPAGALAVIGCATTWAAITPGAGELVARWAPAPGP